MKKLELVETFIREYHYDASTLPENAKQLKELRKEIKFLNQVKAYLEFNPTQPFVEKEYIKVKQ